MSRYLVEQVSADGTDALTGRTAGAETAASEDVAWLYSYVRDNGCRVFSVFEAPDPEAIRTVARRAGLPARSIRRIIALGPCAHVPCPSAS
jgi:hypothetical protein